MIHSRTGEDRASSIADAFEWALQAIGLEEDLPAELIENLTVRYRAIRYAPIDRVSGFFLNEVQRCKEDHMNRAGDLAPLWSSLE